MNQSKTVLIFITSWLIMANTSAQATKLKITINDQHELTATLADNSSTEALIGLLKENPLTIVMQDYGNMEKVGNIGSTLPRNDEQITTEPGDIILYQGSALVIYYAPNSWNFTRLGKIDNISPNELKSILGPGSVRVKLEPASTNTGNEQVDNSQNYQPAYPDPANEYLFIPDSMKSVTIIDSGGNTILKTNKNQIQIKDFQSGLYFLKMETEAGQIVTQKILIN